MNADIPGFRDNSRVVSPRRIQSIIVRASDRREYADQPAGKGIRDFGAPLVKSASELIGPKRELSSGEVNRDFDTRLVKSASELIGAKRELGYGYDFEQEKGLGTKQLSKEPTLGLLLNSLQNQSEGTTDSSTVIEDSSSGLPFTCIYKFGKLLSNDVVRVQHKQSNKTFVAKRIQRGNLNAHEIEELQREIWILQLVKPSPYTLTLHDIFEEPECMFMIMEHLGGGKVIDRLCENGCYSEDESRMVLKRVLLGLQFCHSRRIALRNLAVESLLLVQEGTCVDVKITDFAMAKVAIYRDSLRTKCGTKGYIAPEILEARPAYDERCDMWSLGVVLFTLLGGYRPFRKQGDELVRQIRQGQYSFHKRYWSGITDQAKTLISNMLTVWTTHRISSTEALLSDWIQRECSATKVDLAWGRWANGIARRSETEEIS